MDDESGDPMEPTETKFTANVFLKMSLIAHDLNADSGR